MRKDLSWPFGTALLEKLVPRRIGSLAAFWEIESGPERSCIFALQCSGTSTLARLVLLFLLFFPIVIEKWQKILKSCLGHLCKRDKAQSSTIDAVASAALGPVVKDMA